MSGHLVHVQYTYKLGASEDTHVQFLCSSILQFCNSPEIILSLWLEVEYVELRDGAAADLDPVGALATEPRFNLRTYT